MNIIAELLALRIAGTVVAVIFGTLLLLGIVGVRYIPHSRVGILEKLWSGKGSLAEGRIVATHGEAGFQAKLLRGGLHLGYPIWKYRVHTAPLVTISEGRMGYIYARDGQPLEASQTLGRKAECNSFQDAEAFLANDGQRGRQQCVLREGVYAINTALFVVIAENMVYAGPAGREESRQASFWQQELVAVHGFSPLIVGGPVHGVTEVDTIGVVTTHDGPVLESGELIAPELKNAPQFPVGGHNNFQDPSAFIHMGGRRGKQLQVLTDGTYFINRWFATIELRQKTIIPIGYVGVVISYFGGSGADVTGSGFRYGEQVDSGNRGVWRQALPPGKYPLNPFALKVELVPTVNFVLRWIDGQIETHRYDEQLASIPIITADGYEPLLPLSLVLHIDYEKAPSVVQRFGDVKRLISQTLDPILTAYFRDVAQSSNMLDLLTQREEIQKLATSELGRRFQEYDINCVAVLIGRPVSVAAAGTEDPIDRLFDQLRQRRLAEEQKETFAKQQQAAVELKQLNHVKAEAQQQTHLTETKIAVEVAANRGSAQLAEAERLAKREIALAEGNTRVLELTAQGHAIKMKLEAEAEAARIRLVGDAEATRIAQTGQAEAEVKRQIVQAFGDSRLYALNLATASLAESKQPLVPEKLIIFGGQGQETGSQGLVQSLLQTLLAWKETSDSPVNS
jgi:uncharacterized membrane protein YqiK